MFKFVGGIKSLSRDFLGDFAKGLNKDTAIVSLASGKFTAEKIFLNAGIKKIYSNDISLISVAIGKFLSNQNFKFRFKNDLDFFNSYLCDDPAFNIGVLISALDFMEIKKSGLIWGLKRRAFLKNIDLIIEKNTENFLKEYEPLRGKIEFLGVDLYKILKDDDFCKNKILFGFLPIYTDGYEKLYQALEKNTIWERIEYSLIEDYEGANSEILKKGGIVFTDSPLEKEKDFLIAKILDTGRPSFFYSSIGKNQKLHFIEKEDKIFKIKNVITEKEVFAIDENAEITFLKTTNSILKTIKSDKLGNKRISTGADYFFAVLINGKIIGFFSIKRENNNILLVLQDYTFINVRKISKLLIMLISTKEFFSILKKVNNIIISGDCNILTCVFTDKPVSMKYRGVCELVNRKSGSLTYKFSFDKTIKEQLEKWLKTN